MDLKETKEVLEFVSKMLDDLKEYKEDDGKISASEWVQAGLANAPAAVKALMGIDRVDDELKDLSEDEVKELAVMGVSLVKKLLDVVAPDLSK